MDRQEYIKLVTEQIRCLKAREGVAEELEAHIEDQSSVYRQFGLGEEEASKRAVTQMGDPVVAGMELDHIHRPWFEWKMFFLILVLSMIGLYLQYGIGNSIASGNSFFKQLLLMAVGLLVMLVVYFVDYSIIGKYAVPLYISYTLILLGYASKTGVKYEMETSLMLPMYLYIPIIAGILFKLRGTGYKGIGKGMIFMLFPVLLSIRIVPSLNTGFKLIIVFAVMLLFAISRKWFQVNQKRTLISMTLLFFLLPVIMIFVAYQFVFAEYQKARLMGLFSDNLSYIALEIRKLIGDSQLFSNTTTTALGPDVLPGDMVSTDYIFTWLIYNYGIVAGIVVAGLFLYLVGKAFHISLRQKNQLGTLIGVGCGMIFLLESISCILINLGIGPITTVFLPFLSYAGPPVIVFYILAGLLMSIYRYKNILPDVKPDKKPEKIRATAR